MRHAKEAFKILSFLYPVKQFLMRASAGQCELDSSHCHSDIVREIAKLNRLGFGKNGESSEATLFCAATLHRFGLPYDYAILDTKTLPEMCSCCKAPLWDPAVRGSRIEQIFA